MITDKIDSITYVPDSYRKEVCPAPKAVKIELSPRCNYRCKFCSLRMRECQPGADADMSFELFKRITREMFDAGVEEIGLFYLGESFSNPQLLVRACDWVKQMGMPYVFLTTNGSLAKPEYVENLFTAGLDSLKFSINAADDQQFQHISGVVPRNFQRALSNLKAARKIRDRGNFKCRIYASAIRFDDQQHQRMQALLDTYVRPYVDEVYFLPLYGMALTKEQMQQSMGYTPHVGNVGRYSDELGTGNRIDQDVCWAVFTEGHVRADGHLSACCFGATDAFDVGDLKKVSFIEAWNSPIMLDIRGRHLRVRTEGPEVLRGTMCEVCL